MSAPKKLATDKIAKEGISVKEVEREAGNGSVYTTYQVTGWRQGGKWQRKFFRDKDEAKLFVSEQTIKMENQGRSVRLLQTFMTEDQLRQAEIATQKLGDAYTLNDAVDYYLNNHKSPDFELDFSSAINRHLDYMEREDADDSAIKNRRSVLRSLMSVIGDIKIHQVKKDHIKKFLQGLRSRDGKTKAKKKTLNNYRNELVQFFKWCLDEDQSYCWSNPAQAVPSIPAKKVAKEKPPVITTDTERLVKFMSSMMNWRDGALVKYYALAYFAGIRPDHVKGEMHHIAQDEDQYIKLKTNTIVLPASVTKTSFPRNVHITPALRAWLEAYKGYPIIPTNFDRLLKRSRKSIKLTHDETRHSFISYHYALYDSVEKASKQAGNSESIVRKHYLNLHTKDEGNTFFNIYPDMKNRRAVVNP